NYLYDFYPEKETKAATPTQKASKVTFKQIIRVMARTHLKFLTDFIFKSNPNIDSNTTIPFNILENTLKKLIYKFTTILFTKLNYSAIFASELTIPPYKTKNRMQFCINLARIHLYLSENYHAINYKKFADDFNFISKYFTINSATISIDKEEKYLTIKSDKKFNIQLLFNIPKSLFLQVYNIPSLKNSLEHFNKWFKNFFPIYCYKISFIYIFLLFIFYYLILLL